MISVRMMKFLLGSPLLRYIKHLPKMEDKVIPLRNTDHELAVKMAAECLKKGGVIAVPTDTIYGLAGLTQIDESVDKIYEIKQRNTEKPIAISVGSVDDIYRWVNVTVSKKLLLELLPGPVTVVFERNLSLNSFFNPHTRLIGVRVPDDKFIRDLCVCLNGPIALTSANISSHESALNIEEFSSLWPLIDLIFDNGPITINNLDKSGSTVINLSEQGLFSIIRNGCALEDTVKKLLKYGLLEATKT